AGPADWGALSSPGPALSSSAAGSPLAAATYLMAAAGKCWCGFLVHIALLAQCSRRTLDPGDHRFPSIGLFPVLPLCLCGLDRVPGRGEYVEPAPSPPLSFVYGALSP